MAMTERTVRDVRASSKNRIEWDAKVVGLGLRVTARGVKSFVLSYRFDGKKRLMTLGRASELSLERAREIAGSKLVAVRDGLDPMAERAARKAMPTVSEGIRRYLTHNVPARRAKGRMSGSTAREYGRQLDKYIEPKIGKVRIQDVSKSDVEKILRPLPPFMANRVCALISSLFNLFEHWEYRPQHTNPARGIEHAVEDARDRTLSEIELSALGKALEATAVAKPRETLAIRLASQRAHEPFYAVF